MSHKKSLKTLRPKTTSHFTTREEPNYDSFKPTFSFHRMKYRKKGCLSRLEKTDRTAVVDTLLRLSQLTWREIGLRPRERLGFEHIPLNKFRPSPPATPEVEELMVFRYSDGGRIAGLREYDTYHILIIGPKIYKH